MAPVFRRRISRSRHGGYVVRLPGPERELLVNLVDQLRELLEVTTDDPSVRRLFPVAYNEDPERDREYQQLVRDELLERRLEALATLEATARADELDEEQLTGWLTGLNDLRLVLGTRLDITEDEIALDEHGPNAPAVAVYAYLGALLTEVVDALADDLPPPAEPQT